MRKSQQQILKVAKVLEKRGYHITEVYDQSGFLQLFVNGQPMKLKKMIRLWRSR